MKYNELTFDYARKSMKTEDEFVNLETFNLRYLLKTDQIEKIHPQLAVGMILTGFHLF